MAFGDLIARALQSRQHGHSLGVPVWEHLFTGRPATPLDYGAAGDGTTDDTTELAAMFAAKKVVEIPEGYTFLVSSALAPQAGTRVTGRGTIKLANGADTNVFSFSSKSDLVFEGFTIDGNKANQTAGNGMLIQSCNRVRVHGVRFLDCFNNAILSDETIYFDYSHNYVEEAGNHGISLSGDALANPEHNHGTVSHNMILNPVASGVNASESAYVSIIGNYVRHTGSHTGGYGGIRCSNESAHVSVIGNVVTGMSRGVFLIETSDSSVIGNTCEDCYNQGIFLDDNAGSPSARNTVVGNTVQTVNTSTSAAGGIQIDGSDDNLVAGNVIRSASNMDYGVKETNGSTGNLCYGNRISGATTADYLFLSSESAGDEASYTPVIAGTSTAGSGTYTTQTGRYTRIGNLVHFTARLVWTAHTGTGAMVVSLPMNEAGDFPAVALRHSNISLSSGETMQGHIESNVVVLKEVPTGGGADAFVSMDGSGTLHVTGNYRAA